jgi:hypothetical protein
MKIRTHYHKLISLLEDDIFTGFLLLMIQRTSAILLLLYFTFQIQKIILQASNNEMIIKLREGFFTTHNHYFVKMDLEFMCSILLIFLLMLASLDKVDEPILTIYTQDASYNIGLDLFN